MTSQPIRDPKKDHLLTPANSTLVLIDYQTEMFAGVNSIDRVLLENNVVALAKAAKVFDLPIVLSTVGVKAGVNDDTISGLRSVLSNLESFDRSTTNAWEDVEFQSAVKATGRRKLIMGALWTEICLAFPALDALKEGYEVYVVTDAVGGTSTDAHERAIQRVMQAGAYPITWLAVLFELQRDWARRETAGTVSKIMQQHAFHSNRAAKHD